MVLSIIWFILIAVLWTGYLVLEGFDFGVGMLLPVIAKTPKEKTAAVRTIGPHWDGNEVWLLTAGGATFAAFPLWYATMFSGMYFALFLLLVLLIVRVTAIEWRSKIRSQKWVNTWDWMQTIASYGVPLVLGVAFSNFVAGMKIEAQEVSVVDGKLSVTTIAPEQVEAAKETGTLVFNMTGGFLSLFTLYSIVGGVALVAIFFAHGAQYLSMRTEGELQKRATAISGPSSVVALAIGAIWVLWGQFVYVENALAWIPLVVAAVSLVGAAAYSQAAMRKESLAFVFSSVAIAGAVAWVFAGMAPNALKSSIDPAYSLSIEWASSTQPTLTVMIVVTLIFVPIVLAYTVWSYWVFRGRINPKDQPATSGLIPDKIRPKANFLTGKKG